MSARPDWIGQQRLQLLSRLHQLIKKGCTDNGHLGLAVDGQNLHSATFVAITNVGFGVSHKVRQEADVFR